MPPELVDRIVVDPNVMVGKPVIRGTRIPVELILEKLAIDPDIDDLLLDYPRLSLDDIRACLAYAQAIVSGEDVFPRPLQASGSTS